MDKSPNPLKGRGLNKMSKKKWIKKARIKKGTLSRQLGIPIKENIPMSLLNEIISKENGEVIYYKGKKIVITPKLTKRANLARNLKRIKK